MAYRNNGKVTIYDEAQQAQISDIKPAVTGAETYKMGNKRQSLPQKPELYDFKQTAEMFGVSISTIRRWIDSQSLYYLQSFPTPLKLGRRSRKFIVRDLCKFIESINTENSQ